jgi:malonyl-CoA O-methyltransferase
MAAANARRFSRAAATYDAHAVVQQEVAQQVAALAREWLAPNAQVLDAGCGTGALAALLPDYAFLHCDHAEAMCRATYARNTAFPALCADITALPLQDNVMQGYLSSLCWQWVSPLPPAIDEMQRVLSEGGIAIIATLIEGTFRELQQALEALDLPQRMLAFLPAATVQGMIETAGLTIMHQAQVTYPMQYADAHRFCTALRGIGATAPQAKRPLRRQELQQLMQWYDMHYRGEGGNVTATYHVAFWVVRRG